MAAVSSKCAPVGLTVGAVAAAGITTAVALWLATDLVPPAARSLVMGLAFGAAIVGTIVLCNLLFRRAHDD